MYKRYSILILSLLISGCSFTGPGPDYTENQDRHPLKNLAGQRFQTISKEKKIYLAYANDPAAADTARNLKKKYAEKGYTLIPITFPFSAVTAKVRSGIADVGIAEVKESLLISLNMQPVSTFGEQGKKLYLFVPADARQLKKLLENMK